MTSYTYKKIKNPDTNADDTGIILRKEDNVFIAVDSENIDYQEYLEWAKTNTIEEAD